VAYCTGRRRGPPEGKKKNEGQTYKRPGKSHKKKKKKGISVEKTPFGWFLAPTTKGGGSSGGEKTNQYKT